jgi:hypothetical protein
MVSQPRGPQLETSPPWKPQNSNRVIVCWRLHMKTEFPKKHWNVLLQRTLHRSKVSQICSVFAIIFGTFRILPLVQSQLSTVRSLLDGHIRPFFFSHSTEMVGERLKTRHGHFLSHYLQFVIQKSFYNSTLYNKCKWKKHHVINKEELVTSTLDTASLNNLRIERYESCYTNFQW